jgi:hypothetical protein
MAQNKPTAKPEAKATEATEKKETATVQAKPAEPTSEKLEQLKKDKTAAMTAAAKLQMAGDEKAAEDQFLQVYKIGEDIKKEIAAIRQHELELQRKEKEAAIIKMFDDALAAYVANQSGIGNKSLSIEQKNQLNNDYHAKREIVVNRLLGSRPATAKTGTTSTGTKGATGARIRQMILDNIAAGMTLTEAKKAIVEGGESRGTTGAVATQMIKDGEVTI